MWGLWMNHSWLVIWISSKWFCLWENNIWQILETASNKMLGLIGQNLEAERDNIFWQVERNIEADLSRLIRCNILASGNPTSAATSRNFELTFQSEEDWSSLCPFLQCRLPSFHATVYRMSPGPICLGFYRKPHTGILFSLPPWEQWIIIGVHTVTYILLLSWALVLNSPDDEMFRSYVQNLSKDVPM